MGPGHKDGNAGDTALCGGVQPKILPHCKEYFDIQLLFASKYEELSGLDIAEVLRDYTNIYRNLDLNKSGDDGCKPSWSEFMEGFGRAQSRSQWTYDFYLRHNIIRSLQEKQYFGCFSYEYRSERRAVRLHFENLDNGKFGPLSYIRKEERMADLQRLFNDASQRHSQANKVIGETWLFHVEAYRRLFPQEYISTAKEVNAGIFDALALWGQFLDRYKQIRPDLMEKFIECVGRQTTLDGLKRCFPYCVFATEAPIEHFYKFYNLRGADTES